MIPRVPAPPPSPRPSRRVDQPEPGLFRLRLVKRGPFVAARIRQDFDLFTVEIDGVMRGRPTADPLANPDLLKVWTYGRAVEADEYAAMLARRPSRPDPLRAVDPTKLPPVF